VLRNIKRPEAKASGRFIADNNGGFYGATEDGSTFTQKPIVNGLGIRLHKFQIDATFFYVTGRGVICADNDPIVLSMYLIPSPINHWTRNPKFWLQNRASPSTYTNMLRTPACFSLKILKGVYVQALIGDGIRKYVII